MKEWNSKFLYQHNIKKQRIDPGANLRYLEGGVRLLTAVWLAKTKLVLM